MLKQVMEYFADVEPFLRENEHLAPATRRQLEEIFDNPNDPADLELELAAIWMEEPTFFRLLTILKGMCP